MRRGACCAVVFFEIGDGRCAAGDADHRRQHAQPVGERGFTSGANTQQRRRHRRGAAGDFGQCGTRRVDVETDAVVERGGHAKRARQRAPFQCLQLDEVADRRVQMDEQRLAHQQAGRRNGQDRAAAVDDAPQLTVGDRRRHHRLLVERPVMDAHRRGGHRLARHHVAERDRADAGAHARRQRPHERHRQIFLHGGVELVMHQRVERAAEKLPCHAQRGSQRQRRDGGERAARHQAQVAGDHQHGDRRAAHQPQPLDERAPVNRRRGGTHGLDGGQPRHADARLPARRTRPPPARSRRR